MQTHVRYECDGDVGYLILECDESGKPTTMDHRALDTLDGCLGRVEAEQDQLRAVVVQSAEPKYFLVGANIKALEQLDTETIVAWVQRGHAVFNRLAALPLPVIARVEGYTLGGGLELALACDLMAAAPTARLGQPEARLGMVSGWGSSYRLSRRVGLANAKQLFYTGKILDAQAAYTMGLVDYVGNVDDFVESFLGDLRTCSPVAVAQMKWLLERGSSATLASNCKDEVRASQVCLSNEETRQRISEYLARRKRH